MTQTNFSLLVRQSILLLHFSKSYIQHEHAAADSADDRILKIG